MKLWSKGFEPDQLIDEFTVGHDRELDLELARYDVQGSIAHVKMLASIALLETSEAETLVRELERIWRIIERGEFKIQPGVEDVHSQIEFLLTDRLGDIGKKIHSGRSRNDQVLVDLKLMMRHKCQQIGLKIKALFDILQSLSEQHKEVLMPGYTHLQVAMPSSWGLWFGAYAEALTDDMFLLIAAHDIADENPLGSAAGYGSSFPLDRDMTTRLLGFREMSYNVVAAQMGRGKTERALAAAIASIASTLAHMAMDMCMFMCQNFALVSFPDELTTGSSIMPHKKNPDVWEIMRGRCNRLQSIPGELAVLTANLPLGYNRDLQLMKDIMFPAVKSLMQCLDMAVFMLNHINIRKDAIEDPRYDYLFTVEEVNRLVLSGVPFRDAYRKVGKEVMEGTFKPNREIHHTAVGTIGNLANDRIAAKMKRLMQQISWNYK